MRARVERNDAIGSGAYRLSLVVEGSFRPAEPGQFVMLRVGTTNDPLLPRPFTVYRTAGLPGERVVCEVVYRVVGRGTAMLASMARGVALDLAGPYGRGFSLPGPGGRGTGDASPDLASCVLVAGGMGVASLYELAERASRRFPADRVHVLFGGRTRADLICLDDFRALPLDLDLATEDGSEGSRGTIVDRLAGRAAAGGLLGPGAIVYACGPHGMLKRVAELSARRGSPCQVALERQMACGMGACLGCAVRVRDGVGHGAYEMVCKDGPVFDAARVDWERWGG